MIDARSPHFDKWYQKHQDEQRFQRVKAMAVLREIRALGPQVLPEDLIQQVDDLLRRDAELNVELHFPEKRTVPA